MTPTSRPSGVGPTSNSGIEIQTMQSQTKWVVIGKEQWERFACAMILVLNLVGAAIVLALASGASANAQVSQTTRVEPKLLWRADVSGSVDFYDTLQLAHAAWSADFFSHFPSVQGDLTV